MSTQVEKKVEEKKVMEANDFYELPQSKETVYICTCGLSEKLPFCDGTVKFNFLILA